MDLELIRNYDLEALHEGRRAYDVHQLGSATARGSIVLCPDDMWRAATADGTTRGPAEFLAVVLARAVLAEMEGE